jgi:hypothetical protein
LHLKHRNLFISTDPFTKQKEKERTKQNRTEENRTYMCVMGSWNPLPDVHCHLLEGRAAITTDLSERPLRSHHSPAPAEKKNAFLSKQEATLKKP